MPCSRFKNSIVACDTESIDRTIALVFVNPPSNGTPHTLPCRTWIAAVWNMPMQTVQNTPGNGIPCPGSDTFGARPIGPVGLQSQYGIALIERERGTEIAKRVRPADAA